MFLTQHQTLSYSHERQIGKIMTLIAYEFENIRLTQYLKLSKCHNEEHF